MVSSYGVGAGVATIGASGAVIALFGAMTMKAYLNSRLNEVGRIQLIPPLNLIHQAIGIESFTTLQAAGMFLAISIALLIRQRQTGRTTISHAGHLGGFVGGVVAEGNRQFRYSK